MFDIDGGGAMRVRLGAAAMLVLFVLTACSHSATNNPPSSTVPSTTKPPGAEARASATDGPAGVAVPDPCTLITREEAAKVIGEADSSAIAPGGQPGERSCGYASTASGKLVTVAVWPTDQAAFDKLRSSAGTVTAVAGVGDSAFAAPNALYARKGKLAVNVFVAGITPAATANAALSGLMATALSRI
jgi:hypothetical protein